MKDRISYTQLNMFLRCPYQYYLRYVEGLKVAPDGAMARGQSCHAALLSDKKYVDTPTEGLLSAKMAGEIWSVDQTIDTFNDKIESRKSDTEWTDELPYDTARQTGQEAVRAYHKHAREIIPVEVEAEIAVELDGVPIVGYIDLITDTYNADLKVRKRKADLSVSDLMQLGIYNLYNKKPCSQVQNIIIRKTGVEIMPQEILSELLPIDRIRRYLETFIEMREAGMFPPCAPDSWGCSPDYCGYYRQCKFAQGKG